MNSDGHDVMRIYQLLIARIGLTEARCFIDELYSDPILSKTPNIFLRAFISVLKESSE